MAAAIVTTIQIEQAGDVDVAVVPLPTSLDSTTGLEICQALLRRVDWGYHHFLLDCSPVRSVDSAVLSAIVSIVRKSCPANAKIVLFGASAGVQQTLQLDGLAGPLPSFANQRAALAALQAQLN